MPVHVVFLEPGFPANQREFVRALHHVGAHVTGIGKCYVRKSGLGILVDIHIKVPGDITVREGHDISHAVEAKLRKSPLRVVYVSAHIEPTLSSGD